MHGRARDGGRAVAEPSGLCCRGQFCARQPEGSRSVSTSFRTLDRPRFECSTHTQPSTLPGKLGPAQPVGRNRVGRRRAAHRHGEARVIRRRVRDENAQGLVEFAIVAMVLLLLFLGAVDYGRFLYYRAANQSAARVGAETASNHCPVSGSTCGTTTTATSDAFVQWQT